MLGLKRDFVVELGQGYGNRAGPGSAVKQASYLESDKPWLLLANGGRSSQPNMARNAFFDGPDGEMHPPLAAPEEPQPVDDFYVGPLGSSNLLTPKEVANADRDEMNKWLQKLQTDTYLTTTQSEAISNLESDLKAKGTSYNPDFLTEAKAVAMNYANVYSTALEGGAMSQSQAQDIANQELPAFLASEAPYFEFMGNTPFNPQTGTALLQFWCSQIQNNIQSGTNNPLMVSALESGNFVNPTLGPWPATYMDFSQIGTEYDQLFAKYPQFVEKIAADLNATGAPVESSDPGTPFTESGWSTVMPSLWDTTNYKTTKYEMDNAIGQAVTAVHEAWLINVAHATPCDPTTSGCGSPAYIDEALTLSAIGVAGLLLYRLV